MLGALCKEYRSVRHIGSKKASWARRSRQNTRRKGKKTSINVRSKNDPAKSWRLATQEKPAEIRDLNGKGGFGLRGSMNGGQA